MASALQPVMVEEREDDSNEWLIAFVLLLLLLGANANRPLTLAQRKRAQKLLRSKFENDTRRLALGVKNGSVSVAKWQAEMQQSIDDYARQMAVAGAGALPSVEVQAAVKQKLDEQRPFLDRFAKVVAVGALSALAIAARSKLYGGVGWGTYAMARGSSAEPGWVERWVTRDDNAVCRNCAPRHGQFFLPGQGPMPGWDCLGSCRCERILEYRPETYRRLTGG